MKKLSFAILTLILAIGIFAPPSLAAGEVRITLNGESIDFSGQQPVIINGQTFVPVYSVLEHRCFDGDLDDLDVYVQIIGDNAMLPLRTAMENLGHNVDWDAATNTVAISAINRDGTLVFGGSGGSYNFNPAMFFNHFDNMVNTLVFEGLVSNNAAGEPIPLLATHWNISDDGLTYTFYIDPRAAFSDGRPLTAFDVAFTYHAMLHPTGDAWRFSQLQDMVGAREFNFGDADYIKGIVVIDDHTIQFTYETANPRHIWNFALGILCAQYYAFESWHDFITLMNQPFGSGQFIFVDYAFAQWVELERNDNYWNPDVNINLAGITMLDLPVEIIADAAIFGEIHFGQAASNAENLDFLNAEASVNAKIIAASNQRHVTFNTTRPQLSDHRVRQALAYAFDTHAFILTDAGHPDLLGVGASPFASDSWANPPVGMLNTYDFNMQRAAELMDEAGWLMGESGYRYNAQSGERFAIEWAIYHEAAWPGIMTDMARDTWGQLGIEIDVVISDFMFITSMITDTTPEELVFDIFQMGWSVSTEPDMRGGVWDGSNDQNAPGTFFSSGFRYDRLIELIELGATTMNQSERAAIYHEIAQITNYYIPIWVITTGTQLWAVNRDVHNLEISMFVNPMMAVVQQGTWIAQ